MVRLPVTKSDDAAFIALAERAINGDAALVSSTFLHVVKIDSWFGDRWYAFAGKAVGTAGVHVFAAFKVPPFHPHRVLSEDRFRQADPPERVDVGKPLHGVRSSYSNLRNEIARFGSSVTFGWYSGDSAASGRGSVMAYSSTEQGVLGWYAGFERQQAHWRLTVLTGADRRQWTAMLEADGPKATASGAV